MAYAIEADVRLHAPQAADEEDFAGYIVQAEAVVDGRLRILFEVPFEECPQLVTNIVSRLAAGRFLEAEYGRINQEPPAFAGELISGALEDLGTLVDNPSMIDVERRQRTVDDLDNNVVKVSGSDDGELFNSMDPYEWGK